MANLLLDGGTGRWGRQSTLGGEGLRPVLMVVSLPALPPLCIAIRAARPVHVHASIVCFNEGSQRLGFVESGIQWLA